MYHEVTYAQQRRRRIARVVNLLIVVGLLVAFLFIVGALQHSAREQASASVRDSVLIAAKQCCAVEGSYPSTLEHLEKEYGLVVNHDDYVISYEWFADNVLPTVVVTAR